MIEFKEIPYSVAVDFLLPKHYSGRIPSISKAYGAFYNNELQSVCTFGKPASNSLCKGVCGEEYSHMVYELNRLCSIDESEIILSQFVSYCLRALKCNNWIVISYSDTEMSHNGYIYQACNFIYTGATKKRTDKYTEGNKHSRHYNKHENVCYRKVRSSKHRYVYFSIQNKALKKVLLNKMRYNIYPYPKGVNKKYLLGEYLQPNIISI